MSVIVAPKLRVGEAACFESRSSALRPSISATTISTFGLPVRAALEASRAIAPLPADAAVRALRLKTKLAAVVVAAACCPVGAAYGGVQAPAAAVTAWLPYWEMPAAIASTIDNAAEIGTASPYWYDIAGDFKVHDEAGAGSATVIAELSAHHVQIVPMVTEDAGLRPFARILESTSRRGNLVRTLVTIASHEGFTGIDLDFESFAYDPKHLTAPADTVAALYPGFVAQVCKALHAAGRSCQVTVMARTSSAPVYAHGDIATWVV